LSGRRLIGILLFPGVEELDAIGPWEVLAFWTQAYPEDGFAVICLSKDGSPIRCAKGLVIQPQHSFADHPQLEVFIHPGGRGTEPLVGDDQHLDWVRHQRSIVPIMASVCTGSLVLAAAGLLRDRPATSYWDSLDDLAAIDPTVEVRPDARFVDDGDVITSAGVSAGIDMALHLVHRLAGRDRAVDVRRGIQYDPLPPV
jgi:transcriptional regulator GlxA family with amidase domain